MTAVFQLLGLVGARWVLLSCLTALGAVLWPQIKTIKQPPTRAAAIGLLAVPMAIGLIAAAARSSEPEGVRPPQGVLPPDPYLYATFDGQRTSRRQDCVGLFGLCLDQRIELAVGAFGPNEAAGFPKQSLREPSSKCHGWTPARFSLVEVCEENGSMTSISTQFMAESQFELALPTGDEAVFPAPLERLANEVSADLEHSPEFLGSQDEEGFYYNSLAWQFYHEAEGTPFAVIELSGFEWWNDTNQSRTLDSCDLRGHLDVNKTVIANRVEVRNLLSRDLARTACRYS